MEGTSIFFVIMQWIVILSILFLVYWFCFKKRPQRQKEVKMGHAEAKIRNLLSTEITASKSKDEAPIEIMCVEVVNIDIRLGRMIAIVFKFSVASAIVSLFWFAVWKIIMKIAEM